MAITSTYEIDQSDALCRRFAILATRYIDQDVQVPGPGARVPLENLFRLLQMFRHQAFADEHRKGVLAMDSASGSSTLVGRAEPWHPRISSAINVAMDRSFSGVPTTLALSQVEGALRWLATRNQRPGDGALQKSKTFFSILAEQLAE